MMRPSLQQDKPNILALASGKNVPEFSTCNNESDEHTPRCALETVF